jgi:hypothetical protein
MSEIDDLCESVFRLKERIPEMLKSAYFEGVRDSTEVFTDEQIEVLYKDSSVAAEVNQFIELLT